MIYNSVSQLTTTAFRLKIINLSPIYAESYNLIFNKIKVNHGKTFENSYIILNSYIINLK